MSGLERSPFFTAVELKKTSAKAEGRFRIVEFTVTARGNYAPAAQVVTAAAPQAR
jgi:hypothetical protein